MQSSKTIIVPPKGSVKPTHSLIWLHGLGDSAQGFAGMFQQTSPVSPTTKVILLTAPNSPVTINGGAQMNSWFDIMDFSWAPQSYSVQDVHNSSKKVLEVIEAEIQAHEGDASKVFIGGFSQGCCMSLNIGLTYEKKLGGIIALSGVLLPHVEIKQSDIPILSSHGTDDKIVGFQLAVKSYERIKQLSNFSWHPIGGLAHSLSGETLKHIKTFWQKHAK